jgi:centromeric protein E
MVGEDHSVAAALKEKDAEITDLRARLDDKDRMLAALRSAARSRDTADASAEPRSPTAIDQAKMSPTSPTVSRMQRRRTKSFDEMNKMLEEMIQDRVETGHIIRGSRGSVRLPGGQKLDSLAEPPHDLEPLRQSPGPPASPEVPATDAA